MAPEKKSDIKPRCDKHLTEMEAVRAISKAAGGPEVWDYLVFRCTTPGCSRQFDTGGYTTINSDGSIDPESKNLITCEHPAMFIESIEEDRLIWRCCIDGCERSRTTDRVFRPL